MRMARSWHVAIAGRPELGSVVGSILGYIIGVPVSIWAFAYTLNKKFKGGYEICVIKTDSTKPTSVEEPYVKPYPSNE